MSDNEDRFKTISQQRDLDRTAIVNALEIVRDFIVSRGLVLYGGQAIDYALKLHGDRIYPDEELPDYDAYSPRNVQDAYELADFIHSGGFENVSAIRGRHVQTMRVRVDFIPVFDVTFMPESLFETIPRTKFGKLSIVHPDVLRGGIHRSLSQPFANPPFEEIGTRFVKAISRFNLLAKYYPIAPDAVEVPVRRVSVKISVVSEFALHGFAAFSVLVRDFLRLLEETGADFAKPTWLKKFAPPTFRYGKDHLVLEYDMPAMKSGVVLSLMSPSMRAIAQEISGEKTTVREFNPLLDFFPESLTVEKSLAEVGTGAPKIASPLLEIFSSKDELIPVVDAEEPGSPTINAVNGQMMLLYFITKFTFSAEETAVYKLYYSRAIDVMDWGNELISKMDEKKQKAHFTSTQFGFPLRTMGTSNLSEAYLSMTSSALEKVGKGSKDAKKYKTIPIDYFPVGSVLFGKRYPEFDYGKCPFFSDDGREKKR